MLQGGHGGVRRGAGRKPSPNRKVKRSVTLSAAADAIVLSQMQPPEPYSDVLERVIWASTLPQNSALPERPPIDLLLELLSPDRQTVATLYRRLGWSRQVFERLIQQERLRLAQLGVQLHVATKDAASSRREQYITVDGMRYSALSRDPPQTPPEV